MNLELLFVHLREISFFSIPCNRKAKLYFVFLFFLLALPCFLLAQANYTFYIVNTKREPVINATVTITGANNERSEKLSDNTGAAVFHLAPRIKYHLHITCIGYKTVDKDIVTDNRQLQYKFTLLPQSESMDSVVIKANRPVMRQEEDKTIVDPENIAASSTSAYELLEKTPGLYVDQDGNVYLNGTTAATIYINGRELKMSTADIATMLKSLPPGSVLRIELLRTPSAKYDASSSGGIVNVVLKKGVHIGTTGSFTAGLNQGRYGNQYAGFNMNSDNGKVNTYLNLQINKRNNYEVLQTNRLFKPDSILSQDAYTTYPTNNYYAGYGIGYEFSKKWYMDYEGRLSYNHFENASRNESTVLSTDDGSAGSHNLSRVQNKGNSTYFAQGIDTKLKIDSLGSEWTNDLSFTYQPRTTDQQYLTTPLGNFLPAITAIQGGSGTQKTGLNLFAGLSDLRIKLPRNITLETGIKETIETFTNHSNYVITQANGSESKDNFRTSSFSYKENTNAAYIQGSKEISGILIKAGVRLENTNMDGHQTIPADTSFSIHRTDLFPYIYISRNLMKIAGYDLRAYLVYRRSITRPVYENLNPFPRYVDQYLYETGNPSLRPQFTRNYEANISVGERPIFAVGLNDTRDIFNQVTYQSATNSSIAYRTYDNLGSNKEFYFRAMGAIPPGKRYFFVLGVQYNHNFYQGLYEGKPLSYSRGTWMLFTYQTFKLTPLSQIVLHGYIRLNGQQQFYELSNFGMLNMSINHQFLKKKLIVTLSANDLFFTNNTHFTLNQGNINASGYREDDTRRFGLNFRYNFGFHKKEETNMFNWNRDL